MAQEVNKFAKQGLLGDQARPAYKAYSVTPDDSNDLTNGPCRSLWVNTGGNIVLVARENADSETVTITVADKSLVPIQARRVKSTSTTATGIVALY